jgi:L-methionine (R)-S-oxide reductase
MIKRKLEYNHLFSYFRERRENTFIKFSTYLLRVVEKSLALKKNAEKGCDTMFGSQTYTGSKEEQYNLVIKQLTSLIEDEPNVIANFSNASALLNQFLDRINWVGFYLIDGSEELVLGPFQGLPACVRIKVGSGVCGTAVAEKRTIRVEDVHQFPGHIACDGASRSEIVVPIIKNEKVIGVLDIDSPETDRFDEVDELKLGEFVYELSKFMPKLEIL